MIDLLKKVSILISLHFSLEDDLKIGRLIERRLKAFSDDSTDRKILKLQ